MSSEKRVAQSRLRSSYLTSLISITLVLLLLGIMGALILSAKSISDNVKENIGFSLIIKDDVPDAEVMRIKKKLDIKNYVKEAVYYSKKDAEEIMSKELGEDFVSFLGLNPLPATIDVKLYAEYANPDSIALIKNEFLSYQEINEVNYQESLVTLVNDNIKEISFFIVIFAALLFLVALALINNTIRLMVYSRRFLINTMKLVGATSGFIRKPFLIKSMWQGIIAGAMASGLLYGGLYFIEQRMSGLLKFDDEEMLIILFSGVVVMGVIISICSTWIAVSKYIRIKVDKLYA
ncbi:MAG: permease-like cell division protein FtsX [Bacteroidales bacterium]|nr:permease-like cell division protein FtsX [Bacteroidales bacterium]